MNLAVRCRELVNSKWIFHLESDVKLGKDEWIGLVKAHIEQNEHQVIFEKIKQTVQLWNKHDTKEEIALLVYASKYCMHVEIDKEIDSTPYREITDCMGERQLSFY